MALARRRCYSIERLLRGVQISVSLSLATSLSPLLASPLSTTFTRSSEAPFPLGPPPAAAAASVTQPHTLSSVSLFPPTQFRPRWPDGLLVTQRRPLPPWSSRVETLPLLLPLLRPRRLGWRGGRPSFSVPFYLVQERRVHGPDTGASLRPLINIRRHGKPVHDQRTNADWPRERTTSSERIDEKRNWKRNVFGGSSCEGTRPVVVDSGVVKGEVRRCWRLETGGIIDFLDGQVERRFFFFGTRVEVLDRVVGRKGAEGFRKRVC